MKAAANDPTKDIPLGALGSGSDYSAFLQHLGLPSLDFGYGGEGESGGVYHSLYDDYQHHSTFVDPGFAYDATLAKTVGRAVMRLADTDLPVQRYGDFADTVATYLDEVKKLADTKRDEARTQARLLGSNAYGLAADPTQPACAARAVRRLSADELHGPRQRGRQAEGERGGLRHGSGLPRAKPSPRPSGSSSMR